MTIFTEPRIRETRYLEEYQSTLGDVLGSTIEESLLFSPTSSLSRIKEMQTEELGAIIPGPRSFGDPERLPPATPVLSADDARKRIADEKLDLTVPDEGIREGALNLLMERKRQERKRQDILNRSPTGFGVGSLRLTTALASSLLDPLNVASAFVPAVGPTRYAMMLSRAAGPLGRAGVRAGVGAIEGAVGAALVEPIIFTAAAREQADYDLADSLLNVAFGTVLGGGLHMGAGLVGDVLNPGQWRTAKPQGAMPELLARVAPETREAALRAAVAQAAEGKPINVAPLFELYQPVARSQLAELEARVGRLRQQNLSGRLGREIEVTELAAASIRQFTQLADTIRALESNNIGGRFTRQIADLKAQADEVAATLIDRPGQAAAAELQKRRLAGQQARATEAEKRLTELRADLAKRYEDVTAAVARGDQAEADRLLAEGQKVFDRIETAKGELEATSPLADVIAATERGRGAGRELAEPRRTPQEIAASMAGVREVAQAQTTAPSRLADLDAAADADIKFQEVPKSDDLEAIEADLADAEQAAQTTARALDAEDQMKTALEPFDELVATAESYGNAVRAAALCQLRRGG